MKVQTRQGRSPPARRLLGSAAGLLAVLSLLGGANRGNGAEAVFTEVQVKALFLFNFTKYVEWPPLAFANVDAPIIIGLYGNGDLGDALRRTVAGKAISGRRIVVQPIARQDEAAACHILFISGSAGAHLGPVLARLKSAPVLTVGETDQFMELGGVINFVNREDKIRLEINLEAARRANLEISSQLLSVADVVLGKE